MRKQIAIGMVMAMIALALMVVPSAYAACSDPAGPGVDWSGCDKSGANLSGADLSGANLTGTNLSNSNVTGTDFTGAAIDGLNLSNAFVFQSDFTDAVGTPIVTNAFFASVTCPDGSTGNTTCEWRPTAVTLGDTSATAVTGVWPLALAGLLLVGTAGALLLRRQRPLRATTAV